mgnify:CR=1 FL=1
MQFNKKNEFVFQPDWYRGMEYPKEQERGYDFNEDLYVPGYFEMEIKKGESIVFAAGVKEVKTRGLKKTFEDEMEERTPRDNFKHCLINAAHQFTNRSNGEAYILAYEPVTLKEMCEMLQEECDCQKIKFYLPLGLADKIAKKLEKKA